jgi:hypothetical protein
MAVEDDDILAHFKEQLVQSKHAPAIAAKSREDLIERAQENFGSLFTFIQSVDEATKAELGGGAVTLEFGDYNASASTLDAFITISPPDASYENLKIGVQFQGRRIQVHNSAFQNDSGSRVFGPEELGDVKVRLADAVVGWLKK